MKTPNNQNTLHACYLAYVTQAIVINLAPLLFVIFQNRFSLSFEMIGALVVVNFCTQILVDVIAVRIIDRIGYRFCAIFGHLAAAAGLILLGGLPYLMPVPYAGLMIAVIIYSVGGGLIEVLVSPLVNALPSDSKVSSMSLLHSFYCWGQVIVVAGSTLFLHFLGDDAWFILPALWAILPLFNFFNFFRVPIPPTIPEHKRLSIRQLLCSRLFILLLLFMLCAGAVEQTVAQWVSFFAENGLYVTKTLGDLLGPCLFGALMGISRVIFAKYGKNSNLRRTLTVFTGACILCYVGIVFIQIPILSLICCAACGFFVANLWPGLLNLGVDYYPNGGAAAFGIMAIFGDLGCSIGPWLVGSISGYAMTSSNVASLSTKLAVPVEQFSLKSGIFASIVFAIIMFIGLASLKKQHRQRTL